MTYYIFTAILAVACLTIYAAAHVCWNEGLRKGFHDGMKEGVRIGKLLRRSDDRDS